MNKDQTQKVNMIDTTMAVLNMAVNKTLWTANTAFTNAVTSVSSNMSTLNLSDSTRLASSAPFTETKGQAKVNLIAETLLHAAAGKGYATSVGNTAMKSICSIAESTLIGTKDADLGNLCMNIYTAVQPNIAAMGSWNVNATTLATFNTDITTFSSLVGTPLAQISTQNAAAATIDAQIVTITGILENTIDTLMVQFKTSHAAFYDAYVSARVIHSTGVHHSTTFAGNVYTAAGAALANMKVELSLSGNELRKHFTDTSGHYRFTRLHLGTYALTVSGAGYVTQTKSFTINTLQSVDTNFTMVATGGGTSPIPTPTPTPAPPTT
jgi:hypothetical protein